MVISENYWTAHELLCDIYLGLAYRHATAAAKIPLWRDEERDGGHGHEVPIFVIMTSFNSIFTYGHTIHTADRKTVALSIVLCRNLPPVLRCAW